MRSFKATTAAIALFAPCLAQAAQPACLTKSEFSALAAYAMPSVIEGTSKRCAASLPPQAFLRTSGENMATRYSARKETVWPLAKQAFFKFSGGKNDPSAKFMRQLPDDSLQEIVDTVLEGMVSQEIPLDRCETIDQFVKLLSPLPADNTAELIALVVSLTADEKDGKVGKLSICPA